METFELGVFEFLHTPPTGPRYGSPHSPGLDQPTCVFGFPLGPNGFNLFWGFDTSCYARITPAGSATIVFPTEKDFWKRVQRMDEGHVCFFDGRPLTGPIVRRGLLQHFENGTLGNYRGDPSQIDLEDGIIGFYAAGWPGNKEGAPSVVDFMKGELRHHTWGEWEPTKIEKFEVPPSLRQLMVDRGFWKTLEGNPQEDAPAVREESEEVKTELSDEPTETNSIFPLLLSAALGGVAALALTKPTASTKKQQQLPQNYG